MRRSARMNSCAGFRPRCHTRQHGTQASPRHGRVCERRGHRANCSWRGASAHTAARKAAVSSHASGRYGSPPALVKGPAPPCVPPHRVLSAKARWEPTTTAAAAATGEVGSDMPALVCTCALTRHCAADEPLPASLSPSDSPNFRYCQPLRREERRLAGAQPSTPSAVSISRARGEGDRAALGRTWPYPSGPCM